MTRAHDASRRRFLQVFGTATGALVVGLPALAWTPDELLGQTLVTLNPYLRIEPDGTTVIGTFTVAGLASQQKAAAALTSKQHQGRRG